MTVLVLLATTFGQREYQLFIQADEAPTPVAPDFGVYYVAGLIARSGNGGQLYSMPPEPTKVEQARRVVYGVVPPDTDLAKIAPKRLMRE